MLRSGKRFRQEGDSDSDTSVVSEPTSSNRQLTNEPIMDEKNPMLIPVVLTRLFELCEVKDLLNYRLVSRQWNAISSNRVLKETYVGIRQWNKTRKPGTFYMCFRPSPLQWSTLDSEFKVGEKPFRCFRLEDVEFKAPPKLLRGEKVSRDQQMYKNMQEFWGKYGEFIRVLELDAQVYSVEGLKKAIFEDTPSLEELSLGVYVPKSMLNVGRGEDEEAVRIQPNLKTLKVVCSKDDGARSRFRFPIPWRLVFANFPHIQSIELDIPDEDPIGTLVERFESLEEIPLHELKFEQIPPEQVNSIKKLFNLAKLKLTKVRFEVMDMVRGTATILKLLLRQQGDNKNMTRTKPNGHDFIELHIKLQFESV